MGVQRKSENMGCCGCTLAGLTVTAVVLGLLESILGLSWNILVIVVMSQDSPVNETTMASEDLTNVTETTSNETDYFVSMTSTVDYNTLWENLTQNLKTDPDVQYQHVFELVVTGLVLNALWLITTLGLAVGNAEKCRDMLKPWIATTVIITVTDIAATVYFIFGAIKREEDFDFQTSFFTNIDVFLAVMFSRGGFIWIINIALCVFVAQRVKEIEVTKSKRMPFDSDFHIMAYPPYDAYDTESSTRTSKNFRPHTPPPDYEANGKKRRPSFSSENETMTLPISMASSRTSNRPLSQNSYLYDDRVELQHRASCAAETVLHAYENKGLVMETEGWMGIPRPTLKMNHQ